MLGCVVSTFLYKYMMMMMNFYRTITQPRPAHVSRAINLIYTCRKIFYMKQRESILILSTCYTLSDAKKLTWPNEKSNSVVYPSRLLDVRPSQLVAVVVTAHFLLLDHGTGTACLETSSLPRHGQVFSPTTDITYFGNHTQTLFCSGIPMMYLEVLYVGHYK